ncbi:MAG: putative DNA-binding domain-containing protein, partial [Polaromonas sp.]
QRFGPVATMIERDDHIPPLPELITELAVARGIAAEAEAASYGKTMSQIGLQPLSDGREQLSKLQQAVSSYILHPVQQHGPALAERLRDTPGVDAQQRLGIYHHAYRARLAEVLAESFEKTNLYMGGEAFAQEAAAFAVSHPPLVRNLGCYGAALPSYFGERYPDNPELRELAQLDWDLRECFDGPDVPALDAQSAAVDAAQSWLLRESPLHPSLRLRPVSTNVVQLWKAMAEDAEVPAAEALQAARTLAVWRKGLLPHFLTLEPAQAAFVACLARGCSIAQACEELQGLPELGEPQTLGLWLREWWDEGLLRAGDAGDAANDREPALKAAGAVAQLTS